METVNLAPLCGALGVPRTRVDKWISDGMFTPIDNPTTGKARGWTKQDAYRLACFARLVDAGLKVEVGKAIDRLSGFGIVSEPEFLVVLAHKRTLWEDEKQADGTSKPNDTGRNYDAFVKTKREIVDQLGVPTWTSLVHILIKLDDVKDEVERAWSYALAH
jgi:hypothetical protein